MCLLALGGFRLSHGHMKKTFQGTDNVTKRYESPQPGRGVLRLHGNGRASIAVRSAGSNVEYAANTSLFAGVCPPFLSQ